MEKQYQNWYLQYTSSGTSIDEYSTLVPVPVPRDTGTSTSTGTSTGNQKCGLPPQSQAGRVAKIWDQFCTCGFWFSVDPLPKTR